MAVYGSCIYIFGGIGDRYSNELYQFDVDQCKWTKLEIKTCPTARGYSSMVVNHNRLWIVGGYSPNGQAVNDIWTFEFGYSILE